MRASRLDAALLQSLQNGIRTLEATEVVGSVTVDGINYAVEIEAIDSDATWNGEAGEGRRTATMHGVPIGLHTVEVFLGDESVEAVPDRVPVDGDLLILAVRVGGAPL